jgi:hypothetical protein
MLPLAAVAIIVLATIGHSGDVREEISRPIETEHVDAVRAAVADGGEVIRMKWKLGGFLGTLIGLFIPSTGDALISFAPRADDRTEIGFLVTSAKRDGEYFLYGAEIDERSRSTEAIWSSQMFRGELEQKEQEVDAPNIIDYASGIYRLRWYPPTTRTRMTIWSGGRTYPVEIVPLEEDVRKIAGKKVRTRGYWVRGVKVDGERKFDDDIWVYFSLDERATPVEFVGKRGLVKARIRMIGTDGVVRAPSAIRSE